jgi:hypothetical protein
LDREITSIRRELDQQASQIHDHEGRLRTLEGHNHDHSHRISGLVSTISEIVRQVASHERALRVLIWIVALIIWRYSPSFAEIAVQTVISIRAGG